MTMFAALVYSLLRSLLVAGIGWGISKSVCCLLQFSGRSRLLVWGTVLLPFLTPSLVTGYCYRDTALALTHHPVLKELLYTILLMGQTVPVAVVLLMFAPSAPVSDSALWVASMQRVSVWRRWRWWLGSRVQYDLAALGLLFLLAFQEAELASLMQIASWTEYVFTKHAGGLALSETLRLIAVPVAVQLPAMIPLAVWISRASAPGAVVMSLRRAGGRNRIAVGALWLVLAVSLTCVLPGWQLAQGILRGAGALPGQPSTLREIGDALLLAVTAGGIAMIAAAFWPHAPQYRLRGPALLLVALIPGCMGNLALGISVSGILQTEWLQFAYDTPIPLVFAEACYLLPRAMILQRCLERVLPASSSFVAHQVRKSPDTAQQRGGDDLWWRTRGRPLAGAVVIVCWGAYLELMLPQLLAMPGMAPVSRVLYNSLHYGRIVALGAKLGLALICPVLLLLILGALRKPLTRVGAA